MRRLATILSRLLLGAAILATQAAAGRSHVTCADGTPCGSSRARDCCGAKRCDHSPRLPRKTCVVKTNAGVQAPKPQVAAAPVLSLDTPLPFAAVAPDLRNPTRRAGPVADEIPPCTPPPDGALGPRAPPADLA